MSGHFLFLGLLGTACSNEPNQAEPEKSPEKSESAKEAPPAQAKAKSAPKENPQAAEAKQYDPLAGKKLAEVCVSDSLLLIKWPFDKVQSDFNALCCVEGGVPEDYDGCIMDWPSSDVMACDGYDHMRNAIFARYGRAFKTPAWQKTFSKTDWYEIRKDYTDEWLSDTAQANVKQLLRMKKEKTNCMD
jgi:hypothetical protein